MLKDGTIVRGLRVRFEGGSAVEVDADENGGALAAAPRSTRARHGSASSRWSTARAASARSGPIFYDTLLDENAASHIALGFGYPFAVEEGDPRINQSEIHIDFMIGSPELEVTGVTADGERVPVLRDGDWQV